MSVFYLTNKTGKVSRNRNYFITSIEEIVAS